MTPENTSRRPDFDTPSPFSGVECQQCGTITTIDFQNTLPTTCGFCGAETEDLVEL